MGRKRAPLPQELVEVARRQGGLVSAAQCLRSGVGRQRAGRLVGAGVFVAVRRGVFDVVGVLPPPSCDGEALDRARWRAAVYGVLSHGPTAVATGLAALHLLGVKGVPRTIRPEVALRGGGPSTAAPEVRIRRSPVPEVWRAGGIACVPPAVALAQAVPEVDRMTAVALMDSARCRKVLTARGLQRARELAGGRRGAARARTWWDEADAGSQSPAETRARLTCADAGLAPDVLQLVVRGASGRFLARVDLAWLLPDGRWLLGEVDGVEFHSGRRDVLADLARQNRIVTGRTILRRWTGRQAADGTVAREVGEILRAASWTPFQKAPRDLTLG